MVNIVRHDLEFILRQIKIAEAHSSGTPLTQIYVNDQGDIVPQGTPGAVLALSHPLAPYGLRTVDGSYNNLIAGREEWGAADNSFPRITTPSYRAEGDDSISFGPVTIGGNYGPTGSVADADPRIISNLIVDQTLDNPAAIYAALVYAGLSGGALNAALQAIVQAKAALDAAVAAAPGQAAAVAALQAEVAAATAALTQAQADAAAAATTLQAAEEAHAAEQAEYALAQQATAEAEAVFEALIDDGDDTPEGQAAENAALADLQAARNAENLAEAEVDAAAAVVSGAQGVAAAATAAVGAAQTELAGIQAELAAAQVTAQQAVLRQAELDQLLDTHGVEMEGNSVVIPNVSPDEGLSAPYNSWFTLFGQFFDHGLDLVQKGGNGTIYIPLQPDDPLYDPAHPETNFMVLTRAPTTATNLTTPWVDQNQTYTSSGSHQLFLREYAMVTKPGFPAPVPVATGKLLEGTRGQPQGEHGGLATWADVKAQARTMLGIELTDADVLNVPLFVMDDYGQFVRGPNGFPQMVTGLGADNKFGGTGANADTVVEGNPAAPISTAGAVRTGHAFLDDIAHNAVPGLVDHDRNPGTPMILKTADADGVAGNQIPVNQFGVSVTYDDELLNAHYITGDGRGNENIGLSAVHHIFHSEHNRTVEQIKEKALAAADLAFLNEWLLTDVTALPASPQAIAALQWDGERLFQAARFSTEMQYQHLVFEEFARKVQPDVDAFVFNPSTDINPAIFAEFAHVVYRFGHSMLREDVALTNADGSDGSLKLFDAFLNPLAFGSATVDHAAAAGAIVRGMTSQVGNEIDEFVTHVLRNQLVGIPLDLAALNIARGREAGIPSLNEARAQFKVVANGDTQLDPYTSWTDFALNLKNPASIVNFIAAYGTHSTITAATTTDAKREAAMKLVFGGTGAPADRLDFLNAKGAYAGGSLGGLNNVDLWVGGLAEKKMAFGGMLGSTFSFIFELQLENLQNGDRFYYLSRVQGLNFLNELENNSFAKMVLANTDLGEQGYALPGDIFSVPDHVIYLDAREQAKFAIPEPQNDDPFLEALSSFVERRDAAGNLIVYERNPDGTFVRDLAGNVVVAAGSPGTGQVAAHLRVNTNDHVLIQGTNGNDVIIAGGGDDSVWGRGGNDRIEAGYGVDKIHGGDGDDIITNSGTDIGEVDMLHGEAGNDVIHGGSGLALLFGNEGKDVIITGPDGKEAFGGLGDDFILGGEGGDFLLGNEGDDWIEGGGGFDTTAGDNSELFFNSTIIGHDVMFAGTDEHDFDAESGDDIMVQGESVMRNEGMLGFDWAIHKGNSQNADSDLLVPIFTTDQQDILRDRFDAVEALSGWDKNDTLKGDNRADPALGGGEGNPALAGAENTMVGHQLTQAGVDRIDGLREVLGNWVAAAPTGSTAEQREQIVAFDDGNILLGGGGSDTIEGRGGNDVIDGDAWLNVRIAIRDTNGVEIGTAEGLAKPVTLSAAAAGNQLYAAWANQPLHTLMLSGAINPVQLNIVREIVTDDGVGDIDTAVFSDNFANYSITRDSDGSLLVSHNTVTVGLTSDGTDKLWNIERLQFADQTVVLSPPKLSLNAYDPLGTYADTFGLAAYGNSNGSLNWGPDWVESGDDNSATNANGQIRINGGTLQFDAGNGATIQRAVDLSAAATAKLSFSSNPDNLDDGEEVVVSFAPDGVNFVELATITGNGGTTQHSFDLAGPFTNAAVLRFVASNISAANELVSIDNVSFELQRLAATPSINHQATFTEGDAAVAIASLPGITEDSGTINAATITLTNAQAGDVLSAPNTLPGGITRTIDTTVPGIVTIRMTGAASLARYQEAIQAVTFSNNSQNPSSVDRVIHVSVADTLLESNVAVSTIHVVPVNDAPVATNDAVFTNVTTAPFVIPEWVLLANDTDAEGTALDITAAQINNGSLAAISLATNPGSVTITDNNQAGGTFTYTASDGAATDTAQVTITRDITGTVDGTTGVNILIGDGNGSTFDAGTGDDFVFAGGGNDTILWDANNNGATDGRDFVDGGAGTDTFRVTTRAGTNEVFRVYTAQAALNGPNAISGLIAADLRPGTEIIITRVVGNGAPTVASIIAELDNIEEIRIGTQTTDPVNGGAGPGDTVAIFGDFSQTSLALNTITIDGTAGNDTVDISALASAHRIVFRSNGGTDTIVGTLRPQDVIELPAGSDPANYDRTFDAGTGLSTLSNGTNTIRFVGNFDPTLGDGASVRGGFEMSQSDIDGLKKLINGQRPFADEDDADHALGVRTLSGAGNNEDNPEWGAADTPFIRLTEARYGDYDAGINNRALNPIYEGLDPRAISNILGAQEAGLPHASNNANIFFMAFGQYFDHGLDFIPKNAVNGTVQIGAPGIGQPGQGNPADLTRGEVFEIDGEGVPQHLNKTSTFVDQNQAYGSHNLVGQFLREGDGQGGLSSHLLKGAPDPSNPSFSLLPTLREAIQHHWDNNTVFTDPSLPGGQIAFRTYYSNYPVSETATGNLIGPDGAFDPQVYGKLANNFMGSGQPLLLDTNPFISLLDHYVAGDGRANENFTLTSMHTIWARNHNFHVDNLLASGFTGTEQELFDAAKVLNEAEYQRVVFTEFADALIGGIRGDGDHGNNGYNPDADPGISHEFAAAVYRVGHSLIGQTITVMDANGQTKQVALFDAFLNPSNDADVFTTPLSQLAQYGYVPQPGYEQYGINPILEGIATQPAEQVDFNIVDAVRNDLVRIQADLFSFNVARGRDVGLGTLNQIRKDLAASQNSYVAEAVGYAGNMSAYASWEDFQARNGLSDTVIAQFRQAYPDLVLDTPEKLAAFVAANPDIALVNGNTVKGIDRVDLWVGGLAEKHINGGMVGQTFWVVLHEQFDRLQEADRFYYKDRLEAFDFYEEFIDGQEFADIIARNTGLTDLPENIFEVNDEDGEGEDDGQGDDDEDDDDDGASSGGDDEDDDDDDGDDDDTSSGGDDDDDDDPSCGCDDDDDSPGTPAPNPNPGTGGALRTGTAAADVLIGTADADNLVGLAGDDTLTGHGGADAISAGEGADFVDAGDGRDVVFAGAGDDQVFGGGGADMLYGEAGNDRIFGGAGDDLIDAGAGNDTVVAGSGDDLILGAAGDGDDTYFGDEIDGGNGVDTLDLSAITANLTVDLGNGLNGRGSAVSSQSGTDTLWSIENVATGSGNDTITASEAVNVMEGGGGNDTFRFLSTTGADGDTILDFQPGDRLDLSAIDADASQTGNQSFTLANGASFTASAQLTVTYETRADGEYTIVKGNVDAATDAEFQINLKGSHNLTGSNFIV